MSFGNYKGDSDGKKLVRALLWHKCMLTMQAIRTPYAGSYVLSGHGGDFSVLKSFGISPASITGVDIDPDAADYCRELYPGSVAILGEAGDVAKKRVVSTLFDPPLSKAFGYNAVHLDFNNGLTPKNLRTMLDVAANASSYPLFLGVTMLRGREFQAGVKDKGLLYEGLQRQDRRALVSWSKKHDPIGHHLLTTTRQKAFDARALLKIARKQVLEDVSLLGIPCGTPYSEVTRMIQKKNGDSTPVGGVLIRGRLIASCLNSLFAAHCYNLYCLPVFTYGYHSHNKTSDGVAFGTYGLLVLPWEKYEWYKSILYHQKGGCAHLTRPFIGVLQAKETHDLIRPYALAMDKLYGNTKACELLDVSKATLGAWKAHQTMGTYGSPKQDSFLDYQIHHAQAVHDDIAQDETVVQVPTLGWGEESVYTTTEDSKERRDAHMFEKGMSYHPEDIGGHEAYYKPPWKK